MGAGQTFAWAAAYPDMVERAIPFCGSARTSAHNWVFLASLKKALTTDAAYKEGDYGEQQPVEGLKAFGRIYAGVSALMAGERRRDKD